MNFIDLRNYNKNTLDQILSQAKKIKTGDADVQDTLKNKNIGLLFASASTRTRVSFTVGINKMGGNPIYLRTADLQLSNHESLKDTASVLGRYLDGLVVRMYDMERYGWGRESMNILAKYSGIPVINALDDQDHPCQVMADLLTLKEKFNNKITDKKIVFTWAFAERQKSPGVPHSMLTAASTLGMDITFAHPKGFELDENYVRSAKEAITASGGTLSFSNNLMEASVGADVIYAKSWKALSKDKAGDKILREQYRDDWRISDKHFSQAKPNALFMNCLPIIRGEQATKEVIDRPDSILYDEAENRLYAQQAILSHLFEEDKQRAETMNSTNYDSSFNLSGAVEILSK